MDALDAGCDTFVTADVKYNQFWDAKDLGLFQIDGKVLDKWEIATRTENGGEAILPDIAASALAKLEEMGIQEASP